MEFATIQVTNVVTDALSRKERVKPRRVRAMANEPSSEWSKRNDNWQAKVRRSSRKCNAAERLILWVPLVGSEMDEAHASRLRWMIYLVVLADAAESVRDTIGFEYCLASSSGWTKSPVLWAEIGESSLTGPELVLDTTDKVVLIKEKLKAARDRQKSYADNRRKPLEFEVGDRVMLKVSPWKGEIRFGKKGKLAPSLHVPLDEIKVDKTFRFVKEPVENSDREVKRFLTSLLDDGRGSGSWMFLFVWSGYAAMRTFCGQAKLLAVRYLVKVSWNSKGNFELTWVWEDYLKDKYPRLIVCFNNMTNVADLFINGTWAWPRSWTDKTPELEQLVVPNIVESKDVFKTQIQLRQRDVGNDVDLNLLQCALCESQQDSHTHLFFECPFSVKVWNYMRSLAGMELVPPVL
ncbi:hypothetical protein Tco_0601576 [Tanacetum coccineum]